MKVSVIQSNYIPWRGYFDFIDSVDLFVIYDDVQYSKGSWRNRNQLKFETGLKWVTLPVNVHLGMNINEVTLKGDSWKNMHAEQVKTSLGRAPYYNDAKQVWEAGIDINTDSLSELNVSVIKSICNYLSINTKIVRSEDYNLRGSSTERLMDLFKKTDTTSYLSGPSASDYLNLDLFKQNNISLLYKSYNYLEYEQLQPGFSATVSVLDLIANKGKEARNYLKSIKPDEMVVGAADKV